ncbi:MAG: hypothetical protein Q8R12_00415, partial [bacterium]|nr:hypothetical protein [bacterium]
MIKRAMRMVRLKEAGAVDAKHILAAKYGGLLEIINSVSATINKTESLSLVKVLKIGECPNEENLAKLARKFNAGYGIFDAEVLLKCPYKIPPEAEDSDAMLLFPGAILGFGKYRAAPAISWE